MAAVVFNNNNKKTVLISFLAFSLLGAQKSIRCSQGSFLPGTKVPNIYKILVICLEPWHREPQRLRRGPALRVFTARGRRALAQVCAFRFSFRVSPAALADERGAGSRAGTARSSGGPGVGRRRPGAPGG